MNDLRPALRQLVRRPGSSALAIVTIGVALGATIGVGSIVDHAILRPLAYPDPDRLVVVWNTYPRWRDREVLSRFWDRIALSWPEYEALRANRDVFADVAIYRADGVVLGGSRPEVVRSGRATHGLLSTLRVSTAMGRWFTTDEDRSGGAAVAVLRYEFWQTRFGSDPAMIGRSISVDGDNLEVVGVLPPGFRFGRVDDPRSPDLWQPLGRVADPTNEGSHGFESIVRLRDGVSHAQALAVAERVLRGDRPPDARGARVEAREQYERAEARPVMLLFAGAVGLLLLLACATVGTMQLTRVAERERDIAVRVALGASRWSVARLLLIESAVLGVVGGVVGVLLALATIAGLLRLMPVGVAGLEAVSIDGRLLLLAGALSLLAGVIFGTAPVVRATRRDPVLALRGGSSSRRSRTMLALVGVQSALAVLLLAGAALLIQTVRQIERVDPGFTAGNRLTFGIILPDERYSPERTRQVFEEVDARIAALPGVTTVEAISVVPLSGQFSSNSIWPQSMGTEDGRAKPEAERRIVTPGYFQSMGIPLIEGRAFSARDNAAAEPVMLVARSAARQLWPDRSPIGDRVEMNDRMWTVIGLVDDVRDRTLTAEPVTTVYVPDAQWPRSGRNYVVTTILPPLQVLPAIRAIVQEIDPGIPVRDSRSLEQVIAASTQPERARATLLGGYALLATLLALTGLYGVTSYAASQRTREIGIRLALGARLPNVLRLVTGATFAATLAGALGGALLAAALTGVLRRFLFGVEPADPVVLGLAVILLVGFAMFIGAVPAWRSARVAPTIALRSD